MAQDLICLSHLRWNFVYQRPQHLLSRFAKNQRIFYIEEPGHTVDKPYLEQVKVSGSNILILLPHLSGNINDTEKNFQLKQLIDQLFKEFNISDFILWYYAPMAIEFTNHLKPAVTVYDCMDELSAFKFAPQSLKDNESLLLQKADIVFTGGYNLFNAKKKRHNNIYPFPSSIDKSHFAAARRKSRPDPPDQIEIPHPRLGFYGVIDERLDLALIAELATLQPDWQIVLIGPVVKIDPATLPRQPNIYYLGGKSYDELPTYLSGWDIAIMPFAINESTEFISPTKTPEYLAGGKPVISTSIKDVIDPYGNLGLVKIADTADDFAEAGALLLHANKKDTWLRDVDKFLKNISWDKTWENMNLLINETLITKGTKDNNKPLK